MAKEKVSTLQLFFSRNGQHGVVEEYLNGQFPESSTKKCSGPFIQRSMTCGKSSVFGWLWTFKSLEVAYFLTGSCWRTRSSWKLCEMWKKAMPGLRWSRVLCQFLNLTFYSLDCRRTLQILQAEITWGWHRKEEIISIAVPSFPNWVVKVAEALFV